MISELSITLLPDPVDPAISRCGIDSSAATLIRPLMSLPSATVSLRVRIPELVGFENLAQADESRACVLGTSMPDRRLAGNALDENRFGLQAQAQVFGQRGDAAVLDARFRLELEGGHHRAGIDLHHEPRTLNSSNLDLMRAAVSFSSCCRTDCGRAPR